ncbi:Plasma membrane sulfite pump involved in sulfite metabolism [Lithohypha guttulata]|nr:Plasma membrane sulfite pump involved in sulfite metabolism [Lithohypha guttulata]
MDPSGAFTDCHLPSSDSLTVTGGRNSNNETAVQQLEKQVHASNDHGWRKVVLNFTPSWFSVIMGTGIVSILLHNLPYNGPLGQGSYAIMQLGKVARDVFPLTGTLDPSAGTTFYNLGNAIALIIWGYGLIWLFFALASITRSKFPFNMGWWGFTFPLGVYALSTTMLAKDLPSLFFKILGTIFSLVVVLLWVIVSIKTGKRALKGELFFAPCVEKYEAERAVQEAELHKTQSPV